VSLEQLSSSVKAALIGSVRSSVLYERRGLLSPPLLSRDVLYIKSDVSSRGQHIDTIIRNKFSNLYQLLTFDTRLLPVYPVVITRFYRRFLTLLNQERLKELVHYNPETGQFSSLKTRGRAVRGKALGTVRQDGYVSIFIDGRWYRAHRLAWLYVYGEWPKGWLDHIDRNRANNAIDNLREATPSLNSFNAGLRKDNKSGHRGIEVIPAGPRKLYERYRTTIYKEGKVMRLGTFDSLDEAVAVRLLATSELTSRAANDLYGDTGCLGVSLQVP
jgi:hypothetical protein